MTVQSDVGICNLALDLLGAARIASLAAPRTTTERLMAGQYPQARDSELRKRRWNFAKAYHELTPTGTPIQTQRDLLYRYEWPGNALRAIREGDDDWKPAGRQLLSPNTTKLCVWFIVNVPEAQFDPLFVDMLAAALAMRTCEAITQSNQKIADAKDRYGMARLEAQAINAFEIGPEGIADNDGAFSWVNARNA